MGCLLLLLPLEVLTSYILSQLIPYEVLQLATTNRYLHALCQEEVVWKAVVCNTYPGLQLPVVHGWLNYARQLAEHTYVYTPFYYNSDTEPQQLAYISITKGTTLEELRAGLLNLPLLLHHGQISSTASLRTVNHLTPRVSFGYSTDTHVCIDIAGRAWNVWLRPGAPGYVTMHLEDPLSKICTRQLQYPATTLLVQLAFTPWYTELTHAYWELPFSDVRTNLYAASYQIIAIFRDL
jgi:hypothetical protein